MNQISFPTPQANDSAEVISALKKAGEFYAQANLDEAISWLRKATDWAERADDDMRALTFARAAADLKTDQESATSHPPRSGVQGPTSRPSSHEERDADGTSPGMGALSQGDLEQPSFSAGANGHTAQSAAALSSTGVKPEQVLGGDQTTSRAIRVSVKRSVRDENLFIARLLHEGDLPPGTQEALLVFPNPDASFLGRGDGSNG